jgi:hypothetical protein
VGQTQTLSDPRIIGDNDDDDDDDDDDKVDLFTISSSSIVSNIGLELNPKDLTLGVPFQDQPHVHSFSSSWRTNKKGPSQRRLDGDPMRLVHPYVAPVA